MTEAEWQQYLLSLGMEASPPKFVPEDENWEGKIVVLNLPIVSEEIDLSKVNPEYVFPSEVVVVGTRGLVVEVGDNREWLHVLWDKDGIGFDFIQNASVQVVDLE